MKRRVIAIGPGAASLILVVVVLSMSVLGMLTLMSARNDNKLSVRSRDMCQTAYAMNERAEETLSRLDAVLAACAAAAGSDEDYLLRVAEALPEGTEMDGREVCWQETEGDRMLDCAISLSEWGGESRYAWARHCLSVQMEEYGGIWN